MSINNVSGVNNRYISNELFELKYTRQTLKNQLSNEKDLLKMPQSDEYQQTKQKLAKVEKELDTANSKYNDYNNSVRMNQSSRFDSYVPSTEASTYDAGTYSYSASMATAQVTTYASNNVMAQFGISVNM